MCGIAGLVTKPGTRVNTCDLRIMADAISHRGPDGEGFWYAKNIGLAHKRLSLIDLSAAGSQPMLSLDQRYALTYNGEVYNYRELREELEAIGFRFRSETDSEVVLYSLVQWGTEALTRFNGMFALAFYDTVKDQLLVARDRYGIKPLYYSISENSFSFGSEQKAIFSLPYFKRRLNEAALIEYLSFQNIFTNQTLLKNIFVLEPGSYGILDARNFTFGITKYWDFDFRDPDIQVPDQEYVEELDRLFRQSVNRQLIGDVEIGAYLSGGIDSGSIVAVASNEIDAIKTFTCGFDLSSASELEMGFDERAIAERTSVFVNSEQYETVLNPWSIERSLPKLAHHLEEPRVGQSYPNYFAAHLASKFVKVVLSGCGGDELFGGYPWRYFRGKTIATFDDYIDSYYKYWKRLLDNRELIALCSPLQDKTDTVWTRDIFKSVFPENCATPSSESEFINYSLHFEAKTFLHGLFLVEDKLSMAHGLETRVPFMDNDLVDFAQKCPARLKVGDLSRKRFESKYFSTEGKLIFRELSSRYLPAEITQRRKQGFSSPDASWFRFELESFLRGRLLSESSSLRGILDLDVVEDLIDQHVRGIENRRLLIWSLLNLEAWFSEVF